MRRAVAYLRVSSERQVGNTSIADQAAMLRRWASARSVEIVATFEDDGNSARVGVGAVESFDRRPGWVALSGYLRANPARRGGPDLILFKDYKRFSRDVVAAQTTIKALRAAGVEVQAAEQPIDWAVPEQKILLGLYLADGEVDNDRRAASTRRGMVARLRAGVFIHHPPVGYRAVHDGGRRGGIEPDPEAAALVASAFRLAADPARPVDAGRQMLVAAFGHHRVRSKSRWAETLANRVYAGEVHVPEADGRPAEWVAGQHARIVPPDVWAAVQARLAGKPEKGRRAPLTPALALRGLVVCPEGHPHAGRVLTGSGPRSHTGAQHFYYHTLGAGAYRVRAESVHAAVRARLAAVQPTPEFLALLRAVVEDAEGNSAEAARAVQTAARRDVAAAEAKLLAAADAAAEGRIDADGYAALAARSRALRDDALARIERAVQTAAPVPAGDLAGAFDVAGDLAGTWDRTDTQGRRTLAGSIMPAGVALNPDGHLNPALSPIEALLTGDFEACGAKTKGAVSEETAPFEGCDPDET